MHRMDVGLVVYSIARSESIHLFEGRCIAAVRATLEEHDEVPAPCLALACAHVVIEK